MLPHDKATILYLLVFSVVLLAIWWRVVLRLVAAFIVAALILGIMDLVAILGVAK